MAFKFEWVKKNDGFDPNPATPWLMVPSDGYKEVALPGLKNSLTNFTWTCSGDIGWAPSGGDKLFIFGNKKTGLFRLEARNAAGEVAKLDVSVKKRWTYVIQAFVLHHAGGHVSKRSFGSVGRLVREANEVLGPQTNQYFWLAPDLQELHMSENFGAVITNKEHTLVAIEAAQACWDREVIPLVLIKELTLPGPYSDVEANAYLDVIVIEDDISKDTYVLPHELGHFFSLLHTSNKNGLMHKTSPRGSKLYKSEINKMNHTGTW